jgi:beta-1,4-mannosyltransferase
MVEGRSDENSMTKGHRQAIRVRVSPGIGGEEAANPYFSSIYRRLARYGIETFGWGRPTRLGYWVVNVRPFDVIHVHFPELLLGRRARGLSRARGLAWLAYLREMRLRGSSVVWTAHDLGPHSTNMDHDEWVRVFGWFSREIDAVVHLSTASAEIVGARYPDVSRLPSVVIPHPTYRDVVGAPQDRGELSSNRISRLLFVGRVMAYKDLDTAVASVASLKDEGVRLTVAGRCEDAALATRLQTFSGSSSRFEFGFLPDDRLPGLAAGHDAMLVTQTSFLNSGTIFLGLSLGLPVIVVRTPVTQELRDEIGSDWVRLYDPPLDPDALRRALDPRPEGLPNLSGHDPDQIAASHAALYRGLVPRR